MVIRIVINALLTVLLLTSTVLADIESEKKNSEEIYQTGLKYLNGVGIIRNFTKAVENFDLAYSMGHKKAALELGRLYTTNATGRVDMSKAIPLLEVAALDRDGGDHVADAANFLSQIYRGENPGVTPSEQNALKWRDIAAKNGHMEAAAEMGSRYFMGNDVPKNFRKALTYTETAANLGHAASQFNLGIMYYEGRVIEKDFTKALTWFMVAKNRDLATDNGTIDAFLRVRPKSEIKQAEEDSSEINAGFNRVTTPPVTRVGKFLMLTHADIDVGGNDPTGVASYNKGKRIAAENDDEQQLVIAYANFLVALSKGMTSAKAELDKLEARLSPNAVKFAKGEY